MKLAICIVHSRDKNRLSDDLVASGFKFTILSSTGGFLREGNATFMIGLDDDQKEELKTVIGRNCHAREQIMSVNPVESGAGMLPTAMKVPVGGAVLFFIPVESYERF
ncbi:MAG: cyclic-di-AMP receptor [Chthonomonas sp.]|nr:cyclic-di-AMP receptor [Chthonomonas sp.]